MNASTASYVAPRAEDTRFAEVVSTAEEVLSYLTRGADVILLCAKAFDAVRMIAAEHFCGTTGRTETSDGGEQASNLLRDSARKCFRVSVRTCKQVGPIRRECSKITVAKAFEEEGNSDQGLQKLKEVDTDELSLGDGIAEDISAAMITLGEADGAYDVQLKKIVEAGERCNMVRFLKVTAGVLMATQCFIAIQLSCVFDAENVWCTPSSTVYSVVMAIALFGVLSFVSRTVRANATRLQNRVLQDKKDVEDKKVYIAELHRSLSRMWERFKRIESAVEEHRNAVNEIQKELPIAYAKEVFQQNFSAITCTDDELKRLRDAADALHSTAAASFTRVRAS